MRIRPAPTPLFQFNLPLTWLQVGSLNNFIQPVTRLTKTIGWSDATRSKLGLSLVLNHRNQHLHGWLQCTAMQSLELLLFVIALQQMLILGVIMQHYWGADVSTNRANNISQNPRWHFLTSSPSWWCGKQKRKALVPILVDGGCSCKGDWQHQSRFLWIKTHFKKQKNSFSKK